jgi:predicted nicotinamide N-methyase
VSRSQDADAASADAPPGQPCGRRQRRLRDLQKTLNSTYETTVFGLTIGGLRVELLRVADVDTLLDRLPKIQYRPDERLPYWADLWPSSLALADYLCKTMELRGWEVLELGCGLGLVGIVASQLGGVVTFTDYEADALAFTRYNVLRNRCQQAVIRHLDWHAPSLGQTYALVLASDVLYERSNFDALLRVLDTALGENGQFIFAEPNRPVARDFFRLLRDHGFYYERSTAQVDVGGKVQAVSIYHGRRKPPARSAR